MNIAAIIANRRGQAIISCNADTPLVEAIRILGKQRIGAMPVLRDGRVVGIISERDVVYCIADDAGACLNQPVEARMTSPAITVSPATTIDEALSLMTRRRFRHFPVVEDGELVAFISIGDLVKHKMDEIEHEAAALRDYIQTV
ncbi:MAG: CBS domain-containing protein [Porphyrobacter sp.]|jgi:CBS domain-containing protein|nr:CBS domain-containing protein [Porphyrobacter sp.]